MQELLEVLGLPTDDSSGDEADSPGRLFLTLSGAAMSGASTTQTMSMKGSIQSNQMNIPVDSGSSHTFISQQLADKLQGLQHLPSSLKVQVANGSVLQCVRCLPTSRWSIQGYDFQADLKVLPLSSYDMILGLDWLEQFSPMKVHWKQKWMVLPYKNSSITLFGSLPNLHEGFIIQVCSVQVSMQVSAKDTVTASISIPIQELIEEFAELFEVPRDLPPSRHCDHSIPLVSSASPFRVRPYRFAPISKMRLRIK